VLGKELKTVQFSKIFRQRNRIVPKLLDVIELIPKNSFARNGTMEHGNIGDVIHVQNSLFCVMVNDGHRFWIEIPEDHDFSWEIYK